VRVLRLLATVLLPVGVLALAGSAGVASPNVAPPTDASGGAAVRTHAPVLIAAGDIACDPTSPYFGASGQCQQDHVGHRVRSMIRNGDDWFVPLGDNQYETGTYADYREVFHPAFRAVRSVTRPIPGNHEYVTEGARGYFRYFGAKAGSPDKPWRSFEAAPGWRVLLLDSNCDLVGGCGPRSPQGKWLSQKLASTVEPCVIAAWHHPLQSSGEYAGSADSEGRARKLWAIADDGGVDIVLNGHDHIYERFAKLDGMQQFLVGTGGKNHYDITTKAPGSRERIGNRYGVLRLTLRPDGTYRHAFVAANGEALDRGENTCSNEPVT
jgi:hypothetical protein